MGRLDRTVAVVTGAARGIGAATAALLVERGASVVITDVLDEEGAALAGELGDRAAYRHLDVTSEDDWRRVAAFAAEMFGAVTVLVNNAGILDPAAIEQQSLESFRRTIDVNLVGTWLGMHVLAPMLREAGGGVIVNVSSTAGLTGYPGLSGYCASKWAVRGLTKAAAIELAGARIRVCSVHPGAVRTPMTAGIDEASLAGQPIPRFGEPAEIARMIVFVVDEGTYCTGAEFVVDGGVTAGPPAVPVAP